ncbi:hypothetical protein [Sporichthya sp.]|uniref:hypothetical protein n=1 Tax=Sporichthya sp. TaxID=65475 RepID=UPI0017D46DFF|nr:hypothetical protein [Sporichthya sp.]MBA3741653.1 hypothetical protein [Sporichthya sp.]
MKKQLITIVGVATAAALVIGPLALARKDDATVVGPTPRVFDAKEQDSKDRDIRPVGSASLGDEFFLSQSLSEGGALVGSADTTCTFVRVVREAGAATPLAVSVQCGGVAKIGPDVLTFQGLNSFMPNSPTQSRFAVTGGTGAFADAKGEVRVTETGQGTSAIAVELLDA